MKKDWKSANASSANLGNEDRNGQNGYLKLARARRVVISESRRCEQCNCILKGARASNRRTKYCFSCSEAVKRRQSAEWKREARATLGWQEYQAMYDPYPTSEDKRAYHRQYQQKWRAKNKHTS